MGTKTLGTTMGTTLGTTISFPEPTCLLVLHQDRVLVLIKRHVGPGNEIERIISGAVGVWGRLGVLINNASQSYATPIGSVMEKEWEDLVRANLTLPFFLSQVTLTFSRDLLH